MRRRKPNNGQWVHGAAMLYAIILVLIVTGLSGMILMSFGMSEQLLADSMKKKLGEAYTYQGILHCAMTCEQNSEKTVAYGSAFQQALKMTTWGMYDIICSSVKTPQGDTLAKGVALIGRGRAAGTRKALVLSASAFPLQVGDKVSVVGQCYVPFAAAKPYGGGDVRGLELFQSPSSFPDLYEASGVANRIDFREAETSRAKKIVLADSVNRSFSEPTYIVGGDTVIIKGIVTGNVIVSAGVLIVDSSSIVQNAILKGNKVLIADGFCGTLQVFASDTLIVGKRSRFQYPSIIGLLAETTSPAFMSIGDSSVVYGEVMGCRHRGVADPGDLIRLDNVYVVGGVYSSMNLRYTGICYGGVFSRWTFGKPGGMAQRNYVSDLEINIDSLSSFFSYSSVFPLGDGYKLVQWL